MVADAACLSAVAAGDGAWRDLGGKRGAVKPLRRQSPKPGEGVLEMAMEQDMGCAVGLPWAA